MRYLVGSRRLYINGPNSDYDIHNCLVSPENIHRIKFMEYVNGARVDVHEFFFENKQKVLDAIGPSSVQALLYKQFREFWKITDEEAIVKIEMFRNELRPYEDLYYRRKLLKENVSHQQVKDAYDVYKASHSQGG